MGLVSKINAWRGRARVVFGLRPASAVQREWTFRASRVSWGVRLIRWHSLAGVRWRPPSRELKPVFAAPRWTCYFIYLPDGALTDAHRFTLAALRRSSRRLLVVCAAPGPGDVPADLPGLCDALWWKGLRGYDFSAYRLGLAAIAATSPHADVFVLNDSVLGPFGEIDVSLDAAKWDLTGFTAFSLVENHIQSYAFQLRDVTRTTLRALRCIMPRFLVFDDYRAVVYCQETRFARVASRRMTVGALWYADARECGDPTVFAGPALLEHGFPFMKKSLFGRNVGLYPEEQLRRALADRGHPTCQRVTPS
jgi:lipopolysaccharide biosynthesis protein